MQEFLTGQQPSTEWFKDPGFFYLWLPNLSSLRIPTIQPVDGGKVQLLLTSLAGTLDTVHSRNNMVLEKTLESPLDWKEIRPVNLKGNQPLIFTGRTDAEAPILWLPDAKSWLIRKDPEAGKNWGQEEKGVTEDEMVGWRHWLSGHECEQTPEVGKGQGSLVCYTPWGLKESDTTQRMNNNKTWQEPVMQSLGLGGHFLVKLSSLKEQAWVGGESSFHCHFFAHQSFAPPPPHVHILTPAWVSLSTISSAKHRNMEWKTVISNHFLQIPHGTMPFPTSPKRVIYPPYTQHLAGGSVVKDPPANAGDKADADSIPRTGRSPGGGNDNLLQYSCLENSLDRGAWWATAHGVTKESDTSQWLSMHAGTHTQPT